MKVADTTNLVNKTGIYHDLTLASPLRIFYELINSTKNINPTTKKVISKAIELSVKGKVPSWSVILRLKMKADTAIGMRKDAVIGNITQW